jgi:hypothetical protein
MAEEPQTGERNEEREKLLAALEAADTPPGEETPKSEELASDASESEEAAGTPDPEPEVKAEVTEETSEPTEKPASNREKKSQERMELSWSKTNEAKAELKKEREEFERSKQEHADDGTSPGEYRELAERYKEDGETDLAELAEQKAQEVEGRREQQKHQDVADGIKGKWDDNLKDLQAQYPDLNESDTEMSRGVEHVLDQRPYLKGYPEGIQDAVEFVNSKIASKKVESLEKTNGDLKAEIDELKQQTSVTGSPPAREAAPKGPNEGSQEQIRGKLMDALKAADDSGSGMRAFR